MQLKKHERARGTCRNSKRIKLIMRGLFLTFSEMVRVRRRETENEKRRKKEEASIRHLNNSASNNRHSTFTLYVIFQNRFD